MEKIERGLMVMKNGKAWGIDYEDGYCTSYGWINPTDAPIHNPEFCKTVQDATYKNGPYFKELSAAKLVMIERKTKVRVIK